MSSGRGGSDSSTAGTAASDDQAGQEASAGTEATGDAGSSDPVETGHCAALGTAVAGETTQSITVDGRERSFVRHIPPGYTGMTPVPVVIDFHPLGGAAATWKDATGWSELSDREGFIVIWPDGIDNSWNVGRCCRSAFEQNIDDVGFTKAILATLAQELCIDLERVYATGCSNGGGMAFKLACDASDVIAAVAPVDFDCVTSEDPNDRSCGASCASARPISEIQFRGTADTVVPYQGGTRAGGMTMFPGAQETFMSFGTINMCTGAPEALPDHDACEAYPTCAGDASTILCSVPNGTHCGSYASFGIVDLAWDVFRTKSLP